MISKDETLLIKGIAIIIIVIQHVGQAFNIGLVNPLGAIGVFLFLYISGYGLTCSFMKGGRQNYFKKKIINVYFPYVFAVVLFCIWSFIIGNVVNLKDFFEYIILYRLPQGSYWYLILIFYWYLIFYLLTFFIERRRVLAEIVIMAIASFMIICLMNFSRLYVWQFASFPLGVMSAQFSDKAELLFTKARGIRNNVLFVVFIILMIVIKKLPYVEARELGVVDTVIQIGLAITMSFLVICNIKAFTYRMLVKGLRLFGIMSYPLYLSHVIPLDWFKSHPSAENLIIYLAVLGICMIALHCAMKCEHRFEGMI